MWTSRNLLVYVSYLLGSDFLCLTDGILLYYRTSINKRKGKELSINTCDAVRDYVHQTRGTPAMQAVQYEFK